MRNKIDKSKELDLFVTDQLGHVFCDGRYVTTLILASVNGTRQVIKREAPKKTERRKSRMPSRRIVDGIL